MNIEQLENALEQNPNDVALVSIMAANNETGVIQPLKEMNELCHRHNALFFSDTTQFLGKDEFDFNEIGLDFAVTSSHKISALIGSGLILAKDPTILRPFIFGGGQESG